MKNWSRMSAVFCQLCLIHLKTMLHIQYASVVTLPILTKSMNQIIYRSAMIQSSLNISMRTMSRSIKAEVLSLKMIPKSCKTTSLGMMTILTKMWTNAQISKVSLKRTRISVITCASNLSKRSQAEWLDARPALFLWVLQEVLEIIRKKLIWFGCSQRCKITKSWRLSTRQLLTKFPSSRINTWISWP
jgi:hypothetical protein